MTDLLKPPTRQTITNAKGYVSRQWAHFFEKLHAAVTASYGEGSESAHSALSGIGADDHHDEEHGSAHENSGDQEISIAGLSGEAADPQDPLHNKVIEWDMLAGGGIVLDTGDKIQGNAATSAVVDFTVCGTSGATLKQLADGQLSSDTMDALTATATTVVSSITLVNTDSSARAVNLFLKPSGGTARRIIPKDMSLGAGYSLHLNGAMVAVIDTSGNLLMGG